MNRSIPSKFLAFVLALVMVFSMLPVQALAEGTATYKLVTDVSDLKTGDQIIVVAKDHDYALGTEQKTNNRAAVSVSRSGDAVSAASDVQVLTLDSGTVEGTFAFNTGSGYLYAAGTSKAQNGSKNNNFLKTEDSKSANSSWTISISDNAATVTAQGENGCNLLCYNNNSTIFSAYAAAQQEICLYKLASSGEPEKQTVATPTASPAAGAVPAGTTVTFSCATEGAAIQYKKGSEDWTDYTEPVVVNEAVTFTVKAQKDGMTDSAEATFAYTIQEEESIDTIATALAGESGTSFTVKGVVTLVDGKNVYI